MIRRIINKIGKLSPDFVGKLLVYIPFSLRHGRKVFNEFNRLLINSETWNEQKQEEYIIKHFNQIFQHAKKFEFYKKKYQGHGVLDIEIKTLKDIEKIPTITKEEIRKVINEFDGCYSQNTGGTSGNPLPLYLDKNVWSREWAHYHHIWKRVDYKYTDVKVFFRGLNIGNNFLKYDFQHNVYIVNIFKDPLPHINEFFKVLKKSKTRFFQGYPSAIYDFLKKIEGKVTIEQKELIKSQIKYCLFSSEYPTPYIIDYLKSVWGLDFISCYGHSEICVLAATNINELIYKPYHTYGYVEVLDNRLIGTSYHNFDMPLIRYETGDLVEGEKFNNGVLKSFTIKEGRVGDFIIDKNNIPISLTGLFFGRHHKIFNYIDHIQVFQQEIGKVTFYISHKNNYEVDVKKMMDLENINIDFDYVFLTEPIKTKVGKVPLKIVEHPPKLEN